MTKNLINEVRKEMDKFDVRDFIEKFVKEEFIPGEKFVLIGRKTAKKIKKYNPNTDYGKYHKYYGGTFLDTVFTDDSVDPYADSYRAMLGDKIYTIVQNVVLDKMEELNMDLREGDNTTIFGDVARLMMKEYVDTFLNNEVFIKSLEKYL